MMMNNDPDGGERKFRDVGVGKDYGCLSYSSPSNLIWTLNWRVFIRSIKGSRLQVVFAKFMKN